MEVIYQTSPVFEISTNRFERVPIILQVEDVPMIEVGQFVEAGYTTRFPVYLSDGTKAAVVVGTRIHLTEAGVLAKITKREESHLSVCELDGKPIMELRRTGAASLKGEAELYTPTGQLVKLNESAAIKIVRSENGREGIEVAGSFMHGCYFHDLNIGMLIRDNQVSFGA